MRWCIILRRVECWVGIEFDGWKTKMDTSGIEPDTSRRCIAMLSERDKPTTPCAQIRYNPAVAICVRNE